MSQSILIGRTVTGFTITESGDLRIATREGDVAWDAFGDCCSHSMFSDVPELSEPGRVVEVGEVESMTDPRLDPATLKPSPFEYEDSVEIYGYTLRLNDGRELLIVMRNNSNGYYGGWYTESAVTP
jgi:hypothetical protein